MSQRAITEGDRNEDRSHVLTPPRNVGLTEPPQTLAIPHEVGFEDTAAIEDPGMRHEARLARAGGDSDQRLHFVEEGLHNLRGDFREHRAEFRGLRKDVADLLLIEQTKRVAAIEIDAAKAKATADVDAAQEKDKIAKKASRRDTVRTIALWIVTGGLGGWILSHLIGAR